MSFFSLFTTPMQAAFNQQAIDLQAWWNEHLYKQEYKDSVDFYNMQLADQERLIDEERQYNSAAAQSARMKAAGINPQLQNISSTPTAAGTAPTPNVPKQAAPNVASFIPNLAISLEPLMQLFSSIEDLKSKKLDNKAKEAGIADEILSGLFTEREIDNIVNGFPEIASFSKEEIDELASMGIKLKDIITDPGRSESSYASAMIKRIQQAYEDYGYNRRKSKRLSKMAFERVRNRGRIASDYGAAADALESLMRSTETKSKKGFDKHGNRSDALSDLYDSMYDLVLEQQKFGIEDIGYTRDIRGKEAAKSGSLGFFWKAIKKGLDSDRWYDRVGAFIAVALLEGLGSVSGNIGYGVTKKL